MIPATIEGAGNIAEIVTDSRTCGSHYVTCHRDERELRCYRNQRGRNTFLSVTFAYRVSCTGEHS